MADESARSPAGPEPEAYSLAAIVQCTRTTAQSVNGRGEQVEWGLDPHWGPIRTLDSFSRLSLFHGNAMHRSDRDCISMGGTGLPTCSGPFRMDTWSSTCWRCGKCIVESFHLHILPAKQNIRRGCGL